VPRSTPPAPEGRVITGALRRRVDRLWTSFWSNGISNPLTIVEQISYLLFLARLDDDPGAHFGPAHQHLRWSALRQMDDPAAMLARVRDEVLPFLAALGGRAGETAYARHMRGATCMIQSPALLASVVAQIDALLEDHGERDAWGDLYEYMLSKLSTAGTNGQFRTPRHIIELMITLVDLAPSRSERVCDPACGTAGFLVAAADRVRERMGDDPKLRQHYAAGMFHGFDFDPTMLRLASMNLLLHGVDDPDIRAQDSLRAALNDDAGAYTVVLANPPFKGSLEPANVDPQLRARLSAPTRRTELLFVIHILRLLAPGGRAAIIVPDGVLFGSSKAHVAVRKLLLDDHCLDAVISLPAGVFKPYAGVSTAILRLTKGGPSEQVWFYDMEADGLSLDDRRAPVEANDIPDLCARWAGRDPGPDRDRSARAFFVPAAEIAASAYDLSIARYKTIAYEAETHEPPGVILDRLEALEREIAEDLDTLRELLPRAMMVDDE